MSIRKNIPLDDLIDEEWVPIKGYELLYKVSNMGRIKSLAKRIPGPNGGFISMPDIIMSPGCNNVGYLYVNLVKDGQRKTCTIHRLVGLHFVDNPNPEKFIIVDHIKGVKSDNRASELRWTTSAINNKSAYDLGLKVGHFLGKKGEDNPYSKPVNQFTMDFKLVAYHVSSTQAAKTSGVSASCIRASTTGRQVHGGGFLWRLAIPR